MLLSLTYILNQTFVVGLYFFYASFLHLFSIIALWCIVLFRVFFLMLVFVTISSSLDIHKKGTKKNLLNDFKLRDRQREEIHNLLFKPIE